MILHQIKSVIVFIQQHPLNVLQLPGLTEFSSFPEVVPVLLPAPAARPQDASFAVAVVVVRLAR